MRLGSSRASLGPRFHRALLLAALAPVLYAVGWLADRPWLYGLRLPDRLDDVFYAAAALSPMLALVALLDPSQWRFDAAPASPGRVLKRSLLLLALAPVLYLLGDWLVDHVHLVVPYPYGREVRHWVWIASWAAAALCPLLVVLDVYQWLFGPPSRRLVSGATAASLLLCGLCALVLFHGVEVSGAEGWFFRLHGHAATLSRPIGPSVLDDAGRALPEPATPVPVPPPILRRGRPFELSARTFPASDGKSLAEWLARRGVPRSEVVARPTREVTVHWPPGMIDVLMLLSAVFPARRLAPPAWALLRAARHRPGHCRTCNYNLTGNQSGVCPECGTPLPPTEQKNRATVT